MSEKGRGRRKEEAIVEEGRDEEAGGAEAGAEERGKARHDKTRETYLSEEEVKIVGDSTEFKQAVAVKLCAVS
jgi:hypothetical protein